MEKKAGLVGYVLDHQIVTNSGRSISALFMQLDGNLGLYSAGEALWSSQTYGPSISYLVVQNDGNVVIYRQGPSAWDTRTNR